MGKILSYIVIALIMFFLSANMSAQDDKPLIRVGLVADIQYADRNAAGTRFYRNSLKKLADCVDSLNREQVDFTIHLGDAIDQNFRDMDSVLTHLSHLNNEVFNVTGNHDYSGITDNQILYEKLGMPAEYYAFQKKNWIFILLNTNEVSEYANIKGTEKEDELKTMYEHIRLSGGHQGASYNGGVSQKQLHWLNEQLNNAEKTGGQVLIFSHHPLYPEFALNALNNMEILNVIGNYSCVKAIFSGHHHSGHFAYFKNIPVITVEGMVETETENAFGIIELYDRKIVLKGNGRMRSREFEFDRD